MLGLPRPGRAVWVVAASALFVLSSALAPRADAFVYWTYDKDIRARGSDTIARANLDGTHANPKFIVGSSTGDDPRGVAVDASHLYWANVGSNTIGRANLDGTGIEQSFITGASSPFAVAVDAGHVYWANFGLNTIGRANLDGTGIEQSFIDTDASSPRSVAVDAGHVYWTNFDQNTISSTIGRANLDGSGVEQSFIDTDALGIAVDADHVYWTNPRFDTIGSIGRANLDGTGIDQSFINTDAFGIAVDAGHVYWTNAQFATIGRANLDGSGVDASFITDAFGVYGVAVDGLSDTHPPRTKITKGAPKETDKTKVKFKFKSSEANSTFECKLDKKPYEPCSSPTKLKRLKKGKHEFKVRAVDAAGNVDPSPAKDKFKVVG